MAEYKGDRSSSMNVEFLVLHSRMGMKSTPAGSSLQPAKSGVDARQQHRDAARGNLRAASKRFRGPNENLTSPQLSAAAAALALILSFLEACLDFCWDHGIGEFPPTHLALKDSRARQGAPGCRQDCSQDL